MQFLPNASSSQTAHSGSRQRANAGSTCSSARSAIIKSDECKQASLSNSLSLSLSLTLSPPLTAHKGARLIVRQAQSAPCFVSQGAQLQSTISSLGRQAAEKAAGCGERSLSASQRRSALTWPLNLAACRRPQRSSPAATSRRSRRLVVAVMTIEAGLLHLNSHRRGDNRHEIEPIIMPLQARLN